MPLLKYHKPESGVEDRTCVQARSEGWLAHKVRFGDAGYPDRVFINLFGLHCYIEFKRPGEEPTPIQYHRMRQLATRGVEVTWTDNYNDAIYWLRQRSNLRPARLSVAGNETYAFADGSRIILGSGIRENGRMSFRVYDSSQEGTSEEDAGGGSSSPGV